TRAGCRKGVRFRGRHQIKRWRELLPLLTQAPPPPQVEGHEGPSPSRATPEHREARTRRPKETVRQPPVPRNRGRDLGGPALRDHVPRNLGSYYQEDLGPTVRGCHRRPTDG